MSFDATGEENGTEISVASVKRVGNRAYILSGAVFEPTALNELFPDWEERGAPLDNPVTEDLMYNTYEVRINFLALPYQQTLITKVTCLSLGNLCRWLKTGQSMMNIFPGFAASEILYNDEVRYEVS